MASEFREHSLSNPAKDRAAGIPFENFIAKLGNELHPDHGIECSQPMIARMLCAFFNVKPPICETKLLTFLETIGVYHREAYGTDSTTFTYNEVMSRWEIYTRLCLSYEWSLEIGHEIWEILFWRMYHKFPWWEQWAKQMGYDQPHNKADEFAFHFLLSSQSVPAQAKKRYYDVWEIAKYYSVPIHLAFRALNQYAKFDHRVLFAIMQLDVQAPTQSTPSFSSDLFDEDKNCGNLVHIRISQKTFKKGTLQVQSHTLETQRQIKDWEQLSQQFRRHDILQTVSADPIYRACQQKEVKHQIVSHLFGYSLSTALSVVTRHSPYRRNEAFIQIMPVGCESAFLAPDMTPWEVTMHQEQKKWHRAAKTITNRSASRSNMTLSQAK